MGIMDILIPAKILDTPRLFTGIAEWAVIFVNFLVYKDKRKQHKFVSIILFICFFLMQTGFHILAGFAPLFLWIPNMIIAICFMYFELYVMIDLSFMERVFQCIQSFLIAELAASLYRQLYVWYVYLAGNSKIVSLGTMCITYGTLLCVYYKIVQRKLKQDVPFEINTRDAISAVTTGIATFALSNISFIWTDTPFSVNLSNILYVRTLVDLGGVLVMMNQKNRIMENTIVNQNLAISQLFQRQYEQYKLSIGNSEMLRKEIHDFKHYLMIIKGENSPEKRSEYFEEIEQHIAIQESFQNTGNQVLDVILTNKSLQCRNNNITLNAMVDGVILEFMHVKDICALFGNILDNAIEAVQQCTVPENRLITLSVKKRNNFIIVECTNWCAIKVKLSKDNLPETTKFDKRLHGYGLKSISQIAEKYEGSMTFTQNKDWVTVRVLMTIG